jgi:chromosomal replication initiator protein
MFGMNTVNKKDREIELINKSCEIKNVTLDQIHSKTRIREVVEARYIIFYILRNHYNYSFSAIANKFGKNHATVLLACKKIESLLEKNGELNWNGPAGNKISKAKTILAQLEKDIAR